MKTLLRIENAALFMLALYLYFIHYNFSWVLFLLLLLAPDISMIGYLFGSKAGAFVYNSIHHFALPSILFILSDVFHNETLTLLSLILFAHIFMDRAVGYGLKYTDRFKHTHLD